MTTRWPQTIPDCSTGPGMADVISLGIGEHDPYPIEAAEIGISWEEDQTSQLIADFPVSAVLEHFDTIADFEGRWARWYGNSFDDWLGVETDITPGGNSGVVQVDFSDLTTYMAARLLPNSGLDISGCAGGVIDVLFKYAEIVDTLWLDGVDYEDSGDLVSFQLNGQTLLEAIQTVAQMSGQHWRMDQRTFVWRADLGRDLRRSVQLTEGVEIANVAQPSWNSADVANDLLVVPDQSNYAARYERSVLDLGSYQKLFRRQAAITAPDMIRPASIRAYGKHALAKSIARGKTISVDLVNVNECFSRFRVSDDIRVDIPSLNLITDVHVLQLNYTLSTGLLTLTGEMS